MKQGKTYMFKSSNGYEYVIKCLDNNSDGYRPPEIWYRVLCKIKGQAGVEETLVDRGFPQRVTLVECDKDFDEVG